MKILVIGNGFDIAHNLPSSYTDFLTFLKLCLEYEDTYCSGKPKVPDSMRSFVKTIGHNDDLIKMINDYIHGAYDLLTHFDKVYMDNNWIDFEAEISRIVQDMDKAQQLLIQNRAPISDDLLSTIQPFISPRILMPELKKINHTPELISAAAENLLKQVDIVTWLLEFYLREYVDTLPVTIRLPDIARIRYDHVLTFNYTHTFKRLYDRRSRTSYCYIHGEVAESQEPKDCRLVLGIDEYLKDDRKDTDNAFIWFKKFYQRIYKETSSVYMDWVDGQNDKLKRMGVRAPAEVHFYGHSLDVTDRDVIRRLVLMDNTKVRFYFHDRKTFAKQIRNMVKNIGEDQLIKMTKGSNPTIEFVQSKPAK